MSAVELGVFSELRGGPLPLEVVTFRLGLHPRGARDFMDALVALGLLNRDDTARYANTTTAGRYLDRNSSTYIGGWFEHFGRHEYPHWQHLTRALTSGEAQFSAHDGDLYSSLYADDERVANFAHAMSGATVLVGQRLAAAFPWERYGTFADIGTAEGCLPVQIARTHRHIAGSGFDLPSLRPHFERYVEAHGLGDRLRFCPGDFLRDVLPAADVLILGRVLHNWDLATKRLVLAKTYEAVKPGGALIVYERFIEEDRRSSAAGLLASLNMLVMTAGGSELTIADCIALMEEVGFEAPRSEVLSADQSMIVGFKGG